MSNVCLTQNKLSADRFHRHRHLSLLACTIHKHPNSLPMPNSPNPLLCTALLRKLLPLNLTIITNNHRSPICLLDNPMRLRHPLQ